MVCHVKAGESQSIMCILHYFASNTYFSSHVWLYQCLFLDGQSNIIGGSDTKHNGKALRGQIVGGGGHVGDYSFEDLPQELSAANGTCTGYLTPRLYQTYECLVGAEFATAWESNPGHGSYVLDAQPHGLIS